MATPTFPIETGANVADSYGVWIVNGRCGLAVRQVNGHTCHGRADSLPPVRIANSSLRLNGFVLQPATRGEIESPELILPSHSVLLGNQMGLVVKQSCTGTRPSWLILVFPLSCLGSCEWQTCTVIAEYWFGRGFPSDSFLSWDIRELVPLIFLKAMITLRGKVY